MLINKTGDIFTSEQPAIGHGVNCYGVMGSGIARTVRELFPDVYKAYRKYCKTTKLSGGEMLPIASVFGPIILNLASQYHPGNNASYEFLEESVERAFVYCEENNLSGFALPHIGAGIGGLELDQVLVVLQNKANKHPAIDLEVWEFKPQATEEVLVVDGL